MTYWTDPSHHHGAIAQSWMAHPRIRARLNERISGDARIWPTNWLHDTLLQRLPLARTLSIGSGLGALERDLVRQGIVTQVTGLDFAGDVLEKARAAAEAEGLDARVRYEAADAFEYLKTHGGFDTIFFHQSLHHFERIDELLKLVHDALAPDGVLWFDEFVGRSMAQWTWRDLVMPNAVYYMLPKAVRRVRRIRTPRNPDDPSEAVCAAEILPA
ncbi:MAG TPA: class I SAM-dependent methyltransferase, partial [Thermoanaerobaculia bacterium]|nr:class I SAM-dependent methyltransferase [Thermoanaerobaculia bacterium]